MVVDAMHASQVGFEQFFFDWYGGLASEGRAPDRRRRHHLGHDVRARGRGLPLPDWLEGRA